MEPSAVDRRRPIVVDSLPRRPGDERALADDVARRADPAVQGAAAQALLRRARRASCSTGSASCPSTTRRAPSARSSRQRADEIVAADRRRRARRARLGHGGEDARAAGRDARRRDAASATCRSTSTESMVRERADALAERVPRPARARRRRRLRAPPRPRPAAELGAAHRRVPRRHDRQLPARQPRGASCARSRGCSARSDHLLLGTDLVKDPRVLEAAYDDAPGRHRGVQPQRAARAQPRARRRLRRRRLRARRVLRPRARVDRDAPARARARSDVHVGALDLDVHFDAARGAAHRDQREVHARAAAGRPRAPPACELERWLTDPDELFALSLSPRRGPR